MLDTTINRDPPIYKRPWSYPSTKQLQNVFFIFLRCIIYDQQLCILLCVDESKLMFGLRNELVHRVLTSFLVLV